ncbi:dioxygenase [Rhodospirillales bacterium]|nr:dioxygenase [Rhodospirillales bacterium]
MTYPALGTPALASRVSELFEGAWMGPVVSEARGLDHGAWVSLKLGYPAANIPVTQLSIQPDLDPTHHYQLGQALRPLRDEGMLILASGNLTHNLSELRGRALDAEAPDWCRFLMNG